MSKRKAHPRAVKRGPIPRARTETNSSYFLSLNLENVRCFGHAQTLDLSDGQGRYAPWTILLGENGTGKTTILQALASFELVSRDEQASSSGSPQRTMPRGFGTKSVPAGHIDSLVRGSLGDGFNISSTIAIYDNQQSMKHTNEYSFGIFEPEELSYPVVAFFSPGFAPGRPPICYAYGAGRRLGKSPFNSGMMGDAAESLFLDEPNLLNAEEWLLQLDYSAAKLPDAGARQRERLDMVVALLKRVLPDVSNIRFDASAGVIPKPKVEFSTPYGRVPLRQLGYGYRTMIAWIVDFVSRMVERYPESADPLAQPAVVLVDEIDLHLHPKWQRELIAFLTERFPNTQFIATAHSPLIVQAAIDANFALLRREGDHVVIENDVEPVPGATIEQILTSDLFGLRSLRPPKLDSLLERRKALLTKSNLTANDRKELAELDAKIGVLPVGQTNDEAKRMIELVEETQRLLRQHADRSK